MLLACTDIVYHCCIFTLTIHCWLKKEDISKLANDLVIQTDKEVWIKAIKYALLLSATGVAGLLTRIVLVCHPKFQKPKNDKLFRKIWVITRTVFESPSTDLIPASAVLYLSFYCLLIMTCRYRLSEIHRSLSKPESTTLSIIHDDLQNLCELFESFEDTLSLLPFIIFCRNFALVPFLVIYIREYAVNYHSTILQTCLNYLWMFAIPLCVNHGRGVIWKECNKVEKLLLQKERGRGSNDFTLMYWPAVRQIKYLGKIRLTAWQLFDIDKTLVLTFMANVMTFSVLFIQLTK